MLDLSWGRNKRILTALIFCGTALARWSWQSLAVVGAALERPHALLDRAHHVPVEAVAVLARVFRHDVRAVGVHLTVVGASLLSRWFDGQA